LLLAQSYHSSFTTRAWRNLERKASVPQQLAPGHLYGETLRNRQIAGFELSERIYPARFQTPRHSHKQALFCFVIQGDYTETYGRKTRECRPSTLLFHPAEETHAEHFHDSGGRSFIIEVAPEWLEGMREQVAVVDHSAEFHDAVTELLARRLYKEFAQMDGASALVIEGLMLEMVGEASRHHSNGGADRHPLWLRQARDLLHARFSEHLTLAEVAATVGVHPVHLAQTFHKSYQCTVGDYVRQLRIEYACHELGASETPIVQIALAAGFCDQSHFTRTFKRCIGVAPSQYRQSLRGA
jgi:AraC family transcriptional regulator